MDSQLSTFIYTQIYTTTSREYWHAMQKQMNLSTYQPRPNHHLKEEKRNKNIQRVITHHNEQCSTTRELVREVDYFANEKKAHTTMMIRYESILAWKDHLRAISYHSILLHIISYYSFRLICVEVVVSSYWSIQPHFRTTIWIFRSDVTMYL